MSNKLYVYYEQVLVGTLWQNADVTLGFSYEKSWLINRKAFPLSPLLPINDDAAFDNRSTRAFFENLLPEGKIRERLGKLLGVSLTDSYIFLAKYGQDCAGAFVITPDPDISKHIVDDDYEKVDIAKLAKAHKGNQNLMIHAMENYYGRFSLAGAQDKLPIVLLDGHIYVPTRGAATTHILKPPSLDRQVKDSVFNEYFCMKLAKSCGLPVPLVQILPGEVPFYVIERYDRTSSKSKIVRLHQFDFCQAQNFLYDEKYEEDGGPSLKSNFLCLKDNSSSVIDDSRLFMLWICFNLLIGNNDCHSKNLAFLFRQGITRLAPFYDLLCTAIYDQYSNDFAFTMGGNSSWGKWERRHFLLELDAWGLTKENEMLLNVMRKLIIEIKPILDQEIADFNTIFPKNKTAGRINEEIKKRVRSFEKRFAKS